MDNTIQQIKDIITRYEDGLITAQEVKALILDEVVRG